MADYPTAAPGSLGTGRSGAILAEFRQPPGYRRPNLRRFIKTGVMTMLLSWLWSSTRIPELLLIDCLFAPVALYNGAMYVWRDRFRTRLTTAGIEIRGYFDHFVPWSAVRTIVDDGELDSQPLNKSYDGPLIYRRGAAPTTGPRARVGVIRVIRTTGKSKIVRAPLVTAWAPDPYFEAKLTQMQELARQYGTRPAG